MKLNWASRVKGRAFYRRECYSATSADTGAIRQAFLIFGYDAGVLGGVQTTEPFLNAMGV
ncbi:hypothetical protein LTR37_004859 [Vermiconidia calcicola]|uniref:Uncharacterized protein n=1 Tax=Vermiconidia calcicola TaxID=1690605 RepID=A0ACC3NKE8_9PEZI|nr:hypothetical protein LTR37_004859 [Vermiconidia calcicola]